MEHVSERRDDFDGSRVLMNVDFVMDVDIMAVDAIVVA